MKELNKNISNMQNSYSFDKEVYSFIVGTGKNTKNVILKLDVSTKDDISDKTVTKGLAEYISAFEDILTWSSEK